jgi:hypothetical protein
MKNHFGIQTAWQGVWLNNESKLSNTVSLEAK